MLYLGVAPLLLLFLFVVWKRHRRRQARRLARAVGVGDPRAG
jgi:hypothetical protein